MDTSDRRPSRRYFIHGLLPQLIAFEACVRHGSVTQAGRELFLAQSTVSCMLRKLSLTFGGPLIVLRAGRVEPSPRGEEVLGLCVDILGALHRFEDRGQAARLAASPDARRPEFRRVDKGGRNPENSRPSDRESASR